MLSRGFLGGNPWIHAPGAPWLREGQNCPLCPFPLCIHKKHNINNNSNYMYIHIYIGSNLFDLSLRRRAAAGPGLASTSSTRFRPKMAWRRTWPGAERKPRVDFGRRWFRLFHVADRTVSKGGDCAIDLLSRRQRSGPCEVSILKSDWMKAIAVGGLTRDSL